MTLQYLKRMEALLAKRSANPEAFVLSDYFDLIGGSSAGGVVAAALALGMKCADVERALLADAGRWRKRRFLSLNPIAIDERQVEATLGRLFGERTLDSADFRTGFAVCTKRLDTGSTWIVTNNPSSRFWHDGASFSGNRHFQIRKIARACLGNLGTLVPAVVDVDGNSKGYFIEGDLVVSSTQVSIS